MAEAIPDNTGAVCQKCVCSSGEDWVKGIGENETDSFIAGGEDMSPEFDSGGVLQALYTHGPGIDDVISMRRGGGSYFFLKEYLGNVVAITGEDGVIAVSYTCGVRGAMVREERAGIKNPYRYTGREYNPERGLYCYRARYYGNTGGSFLQSDPAGTLDGLNFYGYVRGDPVNRKDPSGMYEITWLKYKVKYWWWGWKYKRVTYGWKPSLTPSETNDVAIGLGIVALLSAYGIRLRELFLVGLLLYLVCARVKAMDSPSGTSSICRTCICVYVTNELVDSNTHKGEGKL